MISQLTGTIAERLPGAVVVNVGGVGYLVHISPTTAQQLLEAGGANVTLVTHLVVRESVLDLYGFTTREELSFFEMLISVSGIGPKSALAILSLADTQTLQRAIASGDTSHLQKVPGIGKKNAQKIVLELKDKLEAYAAEQAEDRGGGLEDNDTIAALRSLGYSAKEAREAAKHIPDGVEGAGDRVKEALKHMS